MIEFTVPTMPDFGVPAPILHPLVDDARAHTNRWVQEAGLIRSETALRRFLSSDLGAVAAWCYPTAPREHLLTAADMFAWLLWVDDHFDDAEFRHDPPLVERRLRETLDALLTDDAPRSPAGAALREVFDRMTSPHRPAQRRRTLSHFATYFEGILQESHDRAAGRVHDFSTFIERRRFAGGVLLCQDFLEVALGVDLPDAVHATLEMHLFFATVSDVTHWMSDIASYPRDVRLGQVNFLSTVQGLRGGDLQDAADYVATMIRGRMALFDEAVARLPFVVVTVLGLDAEVLRQTQLFAHALRDWIGGFSAWIKGHPRYTAATAARYQTAGYLDEAIFELPATA